MCIRDRLEENKERQEQQQEEIKENAEAEVQPQESGFSIKKLIPNIGGKNEENDE